MIRRSLICAVSPALFVSMVALGTIVGCSEQPRAEMETLAHRFAEHGEEALHGSATLVRIGEGFEADAIQNEIDVMPARLPVRGESAVLFTHTRGTVRVREIGAEGEGQLLGSAVAYPREHGASYWSRTLRGWEEWIALVPGAVRADRPAVEWDLGDATLEQHGAMVLVFSDGMPVLRVEAPVAHTESGRSLTPVLRTNGSILSLWLDANDEAVLIDPIWTPAANMNTPRKRHTATLLNDGRVLVTGGKSDVNPITSAEIYNPTTNSWMVTGGMSVGRAFHTATKLNDGKVLVVGGENIASSEIYDPATGLWTSAGTPLSSNERSSHTATLLSNGRVLVTGGYDSCCGAMQSTDIYNPATSLWTSGPFLGALARYGHTATLLPTGRVLAVGGNSNTAMLFDPATVTWTLVASMVNLRTNHRAALLPDGRVVAVGGTSGAAPNEIYDPAANSWSMAQPLAIARTNHTMTLLPSGDLLVVGGYTMGGIPINSTEIYNVPTNMWSSGPSMVFDRAEHTDTLLPNGMVIVTGGLSAALGLSSAELFGESPKGATCMSDAQCASGHCTDGFCCDTACNAGPCDACSVAAGADMNGTCKALSGPVCNDGNACTQADVCASGVCVGTNPVVCSASDSCHLPGSCDSATGMCSNPVKPENAVCDDANACTLVDVCAVGVCVGTNPTVCAAQDACHEVGICEPNGGMCSNPVRADGTSCPGGHCEAGQCVIDGGSGGSGGMGGGNASSSSSGMGGSGGMGGNASSTSSGMGGNASSSSSSSGEMGGAGGRSTGELPTDADCGCSLPGETPRSSYPLVGIFLALGYFARLRRVKRD